MISVLEEEYFFRYFFLILEFYNKVIHQYGSDKTRTLIRNTM